MTDLTPAQRHELQSELPCLRDPETGVTCALVRSDAYRRMLARLDAGIAEN